MTDLPAEHSGIRAAPAGAYGAVKVTLGFTSAAARDFPPFSRCCITHSGGGPEGTDEAKETQETKERRGLHDERV